MYYGYKARFGFIQPTVIGEIFYYEFYKIVPEGYTLVGANLVVPRLTKENINESVALMQSVGKELALNRPNVVCLAGEPVDQSLADMVGKAIGIPTFAGKTAEIKAMHSLGVKKLAVATPWDNDVNDPLKQKLNDAGFAVRAMKGGWINHLERAITPLSVSYNRAVEAFREAGDADCIYLPCGNWPVADNIAALEKELKVPVVATNQALIWGCFHEIGLHEHISNYGRLLENI